MCGVCTVCIYWMDVSYWQQNWVVRWQKCYTADENKMVGELVVFHKSNVAPVTEEGKREQGVTIFSITTDLRISIHSCYK